MAAITEAALLLVDGQLTRQPFWLSSGRHDLAAWLHYPTDGSVRCGVVICPALGFEYAHAHRTLIHLADRLARSGFAALRFDYPGTGSSSGDESEPALLDDWIESVETCCDFVSQVTGGSPPAVVGLRFGALLAAQATRSRSLGAGVWWAPVDRGRAYAREITALHRVSGSQPETDGGFLEAGGFRYSTETLTAMKALNFDEAVVSPDVIPSLLIEPEDGAGRSRAMESWVAEHADTIRTQRQSDFADMMAEPQFTRVPVETLSTITAWLDGTLSGDTTPIDTSRLASMPTVRGTPGSDVAETMVLIPREDEGALFGIETTPPTSTSCGPTVLLANAGSVHQAGPNRLYVELTRSLAEAGIASVRFDLRNLGDSRIGPAPMENHPYPTTAIEDVQSVLSWVDDRTEGGPHDVTIGGLCSGAYTAFRAALDLPATRSLRVIALNPLTFAFQPGMSLDTPSSQRTTRDARYYEQAVLDRERWKRLLTGQSDVRYILGFLVRQTLALLRERAGRTMSLLRLKPRTRLERELLQLADMKRPVHFIFSSTDPGPTLLRREAGRVADDLEGLGTMTRRYVDGGDHTFSTRSHREEAIRAFVDVVRIRPALRRTVLPTEGLWDAIGHDWSSLTTDLRPYSAFLTPRWTRVWISHFARDLQTRGVVWHDASGQATAATLLSRGVGRLGPIRVSQSHLNTSRVADVGCEHNALLATNEARATVFRDLRDLLLDEGTDEVMLEGATQELFEGLRSEWPRHQWSGYESESPFVHLQRLREQGVTEYLTVLSGNTRGQIRQTTREYEARFGPLAFSTAATLEEAREWFTELVRLHERHWASRSEAGVFDGSRRAFHEELIGASFDGSGGDADLKVDLGRIRAGERTIGILYNLAVDGHVQFYQSGLDYNDDPKLRPGLLSHALAIQHYLDRGATTYDFLGGEPEPVRYKRSMTTDRVPLYWARLPAPTRKMDGLLRLKSFRDRLAGGR